MKRGISIIALVAAAMALLGCNRQPAPIPVSALSFPVIIVTGTRPSRDVAHRARVMANRDQLGRMRVELYSAQSDTVNNDPPIVIDATAAIFDMREIEGEHGSMWMMANPTGMMPIRFKLVPREETGIEAARALVADCEFFEYVMDSEQRDLRRERIRRAGSIADIAAIVAEAPEPQPVS